MNRRSTPRLPRRPALLLALVLALFPAFAFAQTGTVRGTVAGEEGAALAGARVAVEGTRLATVANAQGAFTLANVPAGTQQLRVSMTGHRSRTEEVTVRVGEEVLVAIALTPTPVELDGLVVSASRRTERVTEAPATITRIGTDVLENAVGNSFAGALKQVKGLDFVQVGVTSVAINARGFNSSFNNRMLMMEDGRISVLPENGLPVGQFTATPKVDLAGMEVLVGPGSALYGADASSGVIALQTKDPRQFPGTAVEVTGGSRSYKDVQARHAGVFGNWGYKAAFEFQDADDWENYLTYNINLGGTTGIKRIEENKMGDNSIDWTSRVARGTGALVYYRGDGRFEVSGGMSETDGVGQTNVGRNQLRDWRYNFQQAKYSSPNWYFNAYRAQSQSGESFALNRYADAYARNPNLSPDSLRLLSDWPSDGRMYAAEGQYNRTLGFLNNTAVVVGAQLRQDAVSSGRQWLTDRLTGEDVSIRQIGVYGQATAPVASWADVIVAGRVDDHENYATQFSPKAGVVVKPWAHQAFRVTYNRAFKSPTILQTNFHIPDWTPVVSIYGNTQGFTVRDEAGKVVRQYDPLTPEQNVTWEFGYKGVVANRLFVDVAHYRSQYKDFLSPLAVISNPFTAAGTRTYAFDAQGNQLKTPGGLSPVTLIYYNLGEAELNGTDAGLNVLLTPKVSLRGTMSLVDLKSLDVEKGREEATALNSPELKWTLGADVTDLHNVNGGATVRHVQEYYFRSGINAGMIPGFTTLDARLGWRFPRYDNVLVNLGVNNLFSCGGDFTYDAKDALRTKPIDETRKCGFGVKHQEMINMPHIGTMVFLGLQYQTR
ncbi:MAG TPA: TonB-dependent receptor [Longimicrobiaceae bacterium]|nr:TonB-dependent receptor [Longimicrobiaceae bacterium]